MNYFIVLFESVGDIGGFNKSSVGIVLIKYPESF
jgi:hypothetical protein